MAKMTAYKPGQFSWVELSTSDVRSARSFYNALFGWDVKEIPMGDQGTYYMFQKEGDEVAAMYPATEQEKGIPPHWNSYVSVANVDAAAEKAKTLGGKVVAGPFDVFDAGRMAVISDPQGAIFQLWQAGKSIGAGRIYEPNTLGWNELYTPDIEGSRKFYSSLFDWKLKVSPEYTEVHVGDQGVGGMFAITKEMAGMPPNWTPYFVVNNADATVAKAKSMGGKVHKEATDIPNVGRFAMLADAQGAGFAIIAMP